MPKRALGMLALLALLVAACGEPAVEVEIPPRMPGQRVLDLAGILDEDGVAAMLAESPQADVVALTAEVTNPSLGAADRAGRRLLEEWGADVVIVAVASPGHFSAQDPGRQRFFGLFAADVRDVPRSIRERIVEELVPPYAAENDWTAAFTEAAQALARAQP